MRRKTGPPRPDLTSVDPIAPIPGHGPADGEIELGHLSGIFGISGEVRVFLHNPATDTFDDPRLVVLIRPDGARFRATLTIRPGAGKRILGRIVGLQDRDRAAGLMGWKILVHRDDLPPPDDGFYVHDVIGWPVVQGERGVGTVAGIHPTDGDDILEIVAGDDVHFVPLIARWVRQVDFERRQIVLSGDALEATA